MVYQQKIKIPQNKYDSCIIDVNTYRKAKPWFFSTHFTKEATHILSSDWNQCMRWHICRMENYRLGLAMDRARLDTSLFRFCVYMVVDRSIRLQLFKVPTPWPIRRSAFYYSDEVMTARVSNGRRAGCYYIKTRMRHESIFQSQPIIIL